MLTPSFTSWTILYVLENGIKWRAMPHDLPHWSTVYHYFRKWQKEGIWEKAVQALARQDQIGRASCRERV